VQQRLKMRRCLTTIQVKLEYEKMGLEFRHTILFSHLPRSSHRIECQTGNLSTPPIAHFLR
jgi:hypothetical protein